MAFFEMGDIWSCDASKRRIAQFARDDEMALVFADKRGASAEIYMPATVAQRMAQVWADAKDAGEV